MNEHEIIIPGREAVAWTLARELIDRRFENPSSTEEMLRLFCRCLLAVQEPERTLLRAGQVPPPQGARRDEDPELEELGPGSF